MLLPDQRDRIEIVLVSPRNPLNIGAAARAMANFGFPRLTVVAPYAPHWREAKSAVGAPGLLATARETASIRQAVAHCTFVAGTGTLTHRMPEQPVTLLPELGSIILRELERSRGRTGGESRIALVFGAEKHGLTRDDLAYCQTLVEIPTDPQQPSMNLGQAVAVCLYELTRSAASPDHPKPASPPAVSSAQLDRLADLVEQTMIAARYSPAAMQPANRHDLLLLLRRLALSPGDLRRVLGIFRRILWRLGDHHIR